MMKIRSIKVKSIVLFLIIFTAVISSTIFWTKGFLHSPLYNPKIQAEEKYVRKYIESNSLDYKEEKILAESYWLRYPDIRTNNYWGENGPMGIWGPRDHFSQHGKREGRLFVPVIYPNDMDAEKKLAHLYWQRYPEIKSSRIWGEKSKMGTLGPRDHYQHIGRFQDYRWGF